MNINKDNKRGKHMIKLTKNLGEPPVDFIKEERHLSVLMNVVELMRKDILLIGTVGFGIILLGGMTIATHFYALSGFLTVMGFAIFISTLVSILTYNIFTKGLNFKKEILVGISPSLLPNNTVVKMQEKLEILKKIQNNDQNEVVL